MNRREFLKALLLLPLAVTVKPKPVEELPFDDIEPCDDADLLEIYTGAEWEDKSVEVITTASTWPGEGNYWYTITPTASTGFVSVYVNGDKVS